VPAVEKAGACEIPPGNDLHALKGGQAGGHVADELGISRNRLNELVLGKRSVTADTAIRLERRFKMPARFWLHLQADYDLQTALNEERRARRGARRTARSRTAEVCDG
jgi:addiction module HigA family antidote